MGTRADFYVGRGKDAEWIGSIAWDGYPDGIDDAVLSANSEAAYREAVEKFFSERDDVSRPADGWPWPWENSNTTDYAYAFYGGMVYGTCFGHGWWKATEESNADENKIPDSDWPDMTDKKRMAKGKRSGMILVSQGEDGKLTIE